MELLYISTFMFEKHDGRAYGLPSCSNVFFQKYLDVFDKVHVIGIPIKKYLSVADLVEIDDKRIYVDILPNNTRPIDFKNDWFIKEKIKRLIIGSSAIIIKPASRRGMMAIKLAENLNKPYMIEMTGDIHNALKQSDSLARKLYAPIIYKKIKNAIKNTRYGLYVSKDYLQHVYPIKGKMCGCADVVLKNFDDTVIKRRIKKINDMNTSDEISVGLIGFYQGTGKGVDVAIRAIGKTPLNYHLYVLGNGTEKNRQKWIEYGKKYGVYNRIHFPKPLRNTDSILEWLDNIDIFVLPTKSEGLGRVIVESMSRGCTCLATDICTMPELLRSEDLFSMGDYESLAKKMVDYIHDKEKMINSSIINFNKAKEYDYYLLKQRRNEFLNDFKEYCEKRYD